MQPFVQPNTVFLTIAGSHMYGMATEESDVDKRGVCIPPKNVVMGFARRFEQQDVPGEDTTIFSLIKFMELASDCNPNIIELLFAPDDCIEVKHPIWEKLLTRRDEFVSAKAFFTFASYAAGQIKRINSHRSWLLHPPTHKPTREEFGLSNQSMGVRELAKGIDITTLDPKAVAVIQKEKAFKAALATWHQYQNWKKTRNPKRSELEKKFGFDTKHASHVVRLLRMSYEILTAGKVIVRRPDAAELLAIRRGEWAYEKLLEFSTLQQKLLEDIYHQKKYVVPHSVNKEKLSDFCVDLHDLYWSTTS